METLQSLNELVGKTKEETPEEKKEKLKKGEKPKQDEEDLELAVQEYTLEPNEEGKGEATLKTEKVYPGSRKMYYGASMTPKPAIRKLSTGSRRSTPLVIGVNKIFNG